MWNPSAIKIDAEQELDRSQVVFPAHIPILTYHKIDARREFGINTLAPNRFEEQIQWLHGDGYRSITFLDVLNGLPLPEKPIIFTFDDAYESVYESAAPTMEKYGFCGVLFVVSDFIGRWNDWDIRIGGRRFRHMSADQLKSLSGCGWELGGHTATHRALTHLGGAEIHREICKSRFAIGQLSESPVITFAYPFGLFNDDVEKLVNLAGYTFACKGIRGPQNQLDRLRLSRLPVYQMDDARSIGRKLSRGKSNFAERIRLSLLGYPARLVPYYQRCFRPSLFE